MFANLPKPAYHQLYRRQMFKIAWLGLKLLSVIESGITFRRGIDKQCKRLALRMLF